jgi:hypothetical protein
VAIVYSVAVRNARLAAVVAAIGAGGHLRIFSSTNLLLSSIPLATPCGVVAAGVLTFTTPQTDFSAVNSGNASTGQLVDSANTIVASGLTVGLAGTDLIISSIHINGGDIITFISGTITGN